MVRQRILPVLVVVCVIAISGSVEGAELGEEKAWYYNLDQRIDLEIELSEVSVGRLSDQDLGGRTTANTRSGDVEVSYVRLGERIWRVQIGSLMPIPRSVRYSAVPTGAPTTDPIRSKSAVLEERFDRQRQVLTGLRDDPDVAWAYPGYRNPESGSLFWVTPRLIIGVDASMPLSDVEARLPTGIRIVRPLFEPGQFLVELRDPRSDHPLTASTSLQEDHAWVHWAYPDFIQDWKRTATPNDPFYSSQWHLKNTGQGGGTVDADARLEAAWDLEPGDPSVVVAVVDDGVQTSHPDLPIFINTGEIPSNGTDDDLNGFIDDVNGWDFYFNDNDPNPLTTEGSHGTAVAGVAAATGNNAVGVTGACQNCTVLPVRIFNGAVATSDANIADAIAYAGTLADVINNSWGGGTPSPALTAAIQGANSGGRGGLGSPVLVSNGNSASAYMRFTLSGFPAGDFTISWDFRKDDVGAAGFDTAWIDNVTFPDGTTEDFETCTSLPPGWSTSGDASWFAVSDGTRASSAWGGHCAVQAGAISHDQTTSISVTKTFATGGDLVFYFWASSEVNPTIVGPIQASCYDYLGLTVNGVQQSVTLCGTYSNQGSPLEDGSINYPANVSEAIAVGSVTNFDRRSDYAQWGPENDFLCHSDGGSLGITTTDLTGANGYASGDYVSGFGGTSSAAPLCSGIAALAISANSSLTSSEVRQLMRNSGRKIGSYSYSGGWNQYYGYGAVNASSVVSAAMPTGTIIVEKQTLPDGDPATFTFSGDAAGTISDGDQIIAVTGPGVFTSTETVPGGWWLFDIECNDGNSVGNTGTATATFNVTEGETVTCVFTNCSTASSTVDLSGVTVSGTETYDACDTLTADTFTIQSTGDVRFRAGNAIVLENGFSIAAGGEFVAELIEAP